MENKIKVTVDLANGEDRAVIAVFKDGVMINTKAYNEALPVEEQDRIIKESKGGTWYDGWRPYCLTCSTNQRMERKSYGHRCNSCGNMTGFHGYRLQESPLPPNVEYINYNGQRIMKDLKKVKEHYEKEEAAKTEEGTKEC